MALIGLLLTLLSLGIAADVVIENAGHLASFVVAQQQVDNRPLAALFIGGGLVGLLLAFGLGLFLYGITRRIARRHLASKPQPPLSSPIEAPGPGPKAA